MAEVANLSQACVEVVIIPANKDNFSYLVFNRDDKTAAIIDGSNPKLAIQEIRNRNLNLQYILTTHHHWDHTQGNAALCTQFADSSIANHDNKQIAERVTFGNNVELISISTPGHTHDHISYYFKSCDDTSRGCVFTGDFLFIAGCGHLFEGTARDQYDSILRMYETINDDQAYLMPGHDYTVANLKWAAAFVGNEDYNERAQHYESLPLGDRAITTLGQEKEQNLFVQSVLCPKRDKGLQAAWMRALTTTIHYKDETPSDLLKFVRDSKSRK